MPEGTLSASSFTDWLHRAYPESHPLIRVSGVASAVLAAFPTKLSLTDPGEALRVDSVRLSRGHVPLQVARAETGLTLGKVSSAKESVPLLQDDRL